MLKRNELLLPDSCLNKSDANEPVFVLCARDKVAAQTIRHWATMSAGHQPEDKIEQALSTANEFEKWYNSQPQPCEAIAAPPMISRDR